MDDEQTTTETTETGAEAGGEGAAESSPDIAAAIARMEENQAQVLQRLGNQQQEGEAEEEYEEPDWAEEFYGPGESDPYADMDPSQIGIPQAQPQIDPEGIRKMIQHETRELSERNATLERQINEDKIERQLDDIVEMFPEFADEGKAEEAYKQAIEDGQRAGLTPQQVIDNPEYVKQAIASRRYLASLEGKEAAPESGGEPQLEGGGNSRASSQNTGEPKTGDELLTRLQGVGGGGF